MRLLVFCIALLLSACGFHLKGVHPLPPQLRNVYFETKEPYGNLSRNLKQYMRMSGVHFVSQLDKNSVILNVEETTSQELISVNSSQQTRQYILRLLVNFTFLKPDHSVLIPTQTIMEFRPLTLQSNQILAGSNQADALFQEMRRSIISRIMYRMNSKDIALQLQ